MKPRQIGNFNTGTNGLLFAITLILCPVATIKAMLAKKTN